MSFLDLKHAVQDGIDGKNMEEFQWALIGLISILG
jgi:hypothetical protein